MGKWPYMFKVGLFYTGFPVHTSPVKSNRRVPLRSELLFPFLFFWQHLFRGVVNVFSIYSYISRSLLHFCILP